MKKTTIVFTALIVFISIPLFAQTWSSLKRLTWNSGVSHHPSIASDTKSGIHVVWYDSTRGNYEIFYKHSTDGGAAWSGFKRLTWNAGASDGPCIAVDSGDRIHVVWYDLTPGNYEIFYKHSTNRGAAWSGFKRLTWRVGSSITPSISTSGKWVHVVWDDLSPGNREIFYKSSSDGGAAWSGLKRLTWNAGDSRNPYIAADSASGIHVVWDDDTPGNYKILYKRSTDSGATWSGIKRLSWGVGISYSPCIATDSAKGIYLIWVDSTAVEARIFYKHSPDSGVTWSGSKKLMLNTVGLYTLSLATDSSSGLHVVWYDNSLGNHEIFYLNSTDSGINWSGVKRVTWNAGASKAPSIAADSSDGIHVVWDDSSWGASSEILYRNRK